MSRLADWWEFRCDGWDTTRGVWFRSDGSLPLHILWTSWFVDIRRHELSSFTALTFPG